METSTMAELQALLLDTFILESRAQVSLWDNALNADDRRRIAHTLKGSARAVGLRSVERAAWSLEQYYRGEQEHDFVDSWITRIKYWSDEGRIRNLFQDTPVAVWLDSDHNRSLVYQSILAKEGYRARSIRGLEEIAKVQSDESLVTLVCIAEESKSSLDVILRKMEDIPAWGNAPIMVFSDAMVLPSKLDLFCPAAKVAPGALMTGLNEIRAATA